ncbi:MAG: type II CAAX endopeptidase family protein [Methanobacteriaceae archaeon]|nr:type II CAAX endopeptidase family protein [Methanobacteriaceae archaeon]
MKDHILKSSKKSASDLKKETIVFIGILSFFTIIHFIWFYLNYGSWSEVPTYTTLIHMLIPAISAIICLFIFKDNALTKQSKFFLGIFLVYVLIFLIECFYKPLIPYPLIDFPVVKVTPLLSSIIAVFGFISIIILNLHKKWKNGLIKAKLWFGENKKFFIGFSILFAIIMIILNYLNHLFGFGEALIGYNISNFFNTYLILIFLSFFIIWPQYFGEEFGWRFYLQDRLFTLFGSYIGVIILGMIWGVWHAGNIYMGMNWPGQPILGIINITIFTIVVSVIYGYAVLVTRSVWVAVALHLIMDSSEVASTLYLSQSESLLAFGGGLYSIIILAVVDNPALKDAMRERLYSIIILAVFALVLIILGKNSWKKVKVINKG